MSRSRGKHPERRTVSRAKRWTVHEAWTPPSTWTNHAARGLLKRSAVRAGVQRMTGPMHVEEVSKHVCRFVDQTARCGDPQRTTLPGLI